MNNGLQLERINLSDQNFKFLCSLVYDLTGIVLNERKKDMVFRRVARRMRELNLANTDDYCQLLNKTDSSEIDNFINIITTNLTKFFREDHHFNYIEKEFLPNHLADNDLKNRLRIWSAACSTGEEPYSLSMTLEDSGKLNAKHCDYKILATDLDTEVLATAQAGEYDEERVEDLPTKYREKYLLRKNQNDSWLFRVKPEIKNNITFKQLNLLNKWPMQGPFDLIMCRNVLIYFDRKTQDGLLKRFYELLRDDGVLMLGHSENIGQSASLFKTVGRTTFIKLPK